MTGFPLTYPLAVADGPPEPEHGKAGSSPSGGPFGVAGGLSRPSSVPCLADSPPPATPTT